LAVNLLWFAFKKISNMPSSSSVLFDIIFQAFVIGVSILLLLAHTRSGRNRFVTFLLSAIVLAGMFTINLISYGSYNEAFDLGAVFTIISLVFLITFVLAALRCRKYYSPFRFSLWLAVWTLPVTICVIAAVFCIVSIVRGARFSSSIVLQLTFVSVVLSLFICFAELPFIILAVKCSLFRKRFHECFRLRGMDFVTEKAPAPDHIMLTKAAGKETDTEKKVSNAWMDPPAPKDD
jgi:hypothetical protein